VNNWRLQAAKLDWSDQQTPVASDFDDVYYSKDDPYGEVDYVFLEGNHLAERFQALSRSKPSSSAHFIIGETGFGTGLNFLRTLKLWLSTEASKSHSLHFISVEKHPLDLEGLTQAHSNWPELAIFAEQLQANYPYLYQGIHRINLDFSEHFAHSLPIKLSLIFDNAEAGFQSLLTSSHPLAKVSQTQAVDAWFLDGFAPSKNQSMWSDTLFELMARLSHRQTSFATFTAAGFVKRGLQAQGFEVKKTKGFARKRERLIGQFQGLPQVHTHLVSTSKGFKYGDFWAYRQSESPQTPNPQSPIVIIGAGIAGLSLAFQLAQSGKQVTLIDKACDAMQEASGNPQAVLFPKLSADKKAFSEFNLHSLLYALRFYTAVNRYAEQQQLTKPFSSCGLLQCIEDRELEDSSKIAETFPELSELIQAEQATTLAGTKLKHNCLHFSELGFVHTQHLKNCLSQHPNIHLLNNTELLSIQSSSLQNQNIQNQHTHSAKSKPEHTHYSLKLQQAEKVLSIQAQQVVLASAFAAKSILESKYSEASPAPCHLDIKTIRGQVSKVEVSSESSPYPQLTKLICHQGYISPPLKLDEKTQYSFGATFDLHNQNPEPESTSDEKNIKQLQHYLSDFSALRLSDITDSRVNFRCTSHDYMPIAGPVINEQALYRSTQTKIPFEHYRKNAKAHIPEVLETHPGLFLHIANGSRGFSSSPLTSEVLCAYLLNAPMPVEQHIREALHPGRFLIKRLKRNKALNPKTQPE